MRGISSLKIMWVGVRQPRCLVPSHTGFPVDRPIIETDLEIRPVHSRAWADVGTGAIVLPGVTIGKGSIIGAGAVVTREVPPFSVVAGVPARFLRWREEHEPAKQQKVSRRKTS